MPVQEDERLSALEAHAAHTEWRLGRLEAASAAALADLERQAAVRARREAVRDTLDRLAAQPAPPVFTQRRSGPPPTPMQDRGQAPILHTDPMQEGGQAPILQRGSSAQVSLEDLIGGRLLAWVGGLAVLVGIAFLLVMGVRHGWIGEQARVLMAAGASLALFLAGGRLYERKGRTDAAGTMASIGIVGLDASLVTAAQAYHLLPAALALGLAALVGALATALSLRWEALPVTAVAVLGSLLAPAAVGATDGFLPVAFLAIGFAAAAAICVQRDIEWLGLSAYTVVTPQWVLMLAGADSHPTTTAALTALLLFGALGVATAIGFELREKADDLRLPAAFLLTINALVSAGAGHLLLHGQLANVWLVVVALAHIAVGLGLRTEHASHELRLTSLAIGVLVGDVAAATILHGPWLAGSWAVSSVLFAVLGRAHNERTDDRILIGAGLTMHTALAIGHALIFDAAPTDYANGFDAAGLLIVALIASTCFISARISDTTVRGLLDSLGLAFVAYLTGASLDGAWCAVAFAGEAIALARLRATDSNAIEGVVIAGSLSFLAAALCQAFAVAGGVAPLIEGLTQPLDAALALGAATIATAVAARFLPESLDDVPLRGTLYGIAAIVALFLGSVELVTPFQLNGSMEGVAAGQLSVRQQGQALLSGMWALIGLTALIAGLRANRRELRIGALLLLGVAAGKLLVYDLSELTEIWRVLSFIATGILLLVGAYAWQRLRPREQADIREVPEALR